MRYKKMLVLSLSLILAICIIILRDAQVENVSINEPTIMIDNSENSFVPSKYFVEAEKIKVEETTEIISTQAEENVTKNEPKVTTINRGGKRYVVTNEEFEILSRIAASETTGCTLEQKMNVVQAVLNRVEDSRFPNTIKEVVFAKNQFSVISDGRYYSEPITELDEEAVANVLQSPYLHSALFFEAKWGDSAWFKTLDFQFSDGAHKFYN